MHLQRIHRPRTVLLTIFIFAFIFVLILNVLVHQLHRIPSSELIESSNDQDGLTYLELEKSHLRFDSYSANGLRKPKAAEEKVQDESNPETDYGANGNQQQNKVKVYKFQSRNEIPSFKDKIVNNDGKSDEDYDDEINDSVINNNDDDDDDDINNVEIDDADEDEDDYQNDETNDNVLKIKPVENNIFEPHDFKNLSKLIFTKPPLKYQELGVQETSVTTKEEEHWKQIIYQGKYLTKDGIYWSSTAEKFVPRGFSDEEALKYITNVQRQSVRRLSPPTWDHCGRPQNAFLTLEDGLTMCARYRHPHIKLVLGEVLSFYLSRLLKMDNVPAVVLSLTDPSSHQWSNTDIHTLQWESNKLVALIQWIPNLESFKSAVKIPPRILKAYQENTPITAKSLYYSNVTRSETMDLVQWGSMFIFDYLTGNYDRVASMQDAAEEQKNPKIILDNIRNLLQSTKTSKLWLIDNESGLLDAYDLLYQTVHGGDRFIKFHKQMLQTVCVFQKPVADAIRHLSGSSEPHVTLYKYAMSHDPILRQVLKTQYFEVLETKFVQRLQEVYDWIKYCESQVTR